MNDQISKVVAGDLSGGFRDFPILPQVELKRPHLLDTIKQMLVQDAPIVFLESPEGMGVTTLAAQFALENDRNTFSLFVKPASKFSYNPDFLRLLLAEQFSLWLYGKVLTQDTIDTSEFSSILLKVRRKTKSNPIYFVVDGVHQIPNEDTRFIQQIFSDVLPIGVEPFRFIVSGPSETLSKYIGKTKYKTFQVIKFTYAESESLLSGLCSSKEECGQLEKLCQGIPGRLASVQRLLQSGKSAADILNADPTQTPEFVRLEFMNLDELLEKEKLIIAVLAFGRQAMGVEDVARITGSDKSEINCVIEKCIFIDVNEQTSVVEFRSEGHRLFAESKLESFRGAAITLQIDSLRDDPNSAVAVRLLPNYYQQQDNQRAIVELLSPAHYQRLLEVTGSVSALRLRASLGARSAKALNEAAAIFQFSLQRSIFSAVSEIGEGEAEVAALVALGQPQRALDLAAAATAKESRLRLLAAYARKVVEDGGEVDNETLNYIKETAAGIDFSELGSQAEKIASNIVFVDQDLAFSIVDASTKAAPSEEARDAAYAKLSVAATIGEAKDSAVVNERARQKIGSNKLHHMLSALNLISSKFTFKDVVAAAEKMEIARRVFFLRSLVVVGKSRKNVLDIVEYALDQIVSDVGYSPKTKDFSDLAVALSFVEEDLARVVRIAARISGQLGLIGKLATSKDYVELQMRLAHVEIKTNIDAAKDRIAETYYDVSSIGSIEIKVDCLAIMLQSLLTFDRNDVLEKSDGFRRVITEDLGAGLELLLEGTANQFEVVREALIALARADSSAAFDLVSRLNMESRRDQGYAEIARCLVSSEFCEMRYAEVKRALSLIVNPKVRDSAIGDAFTSIDREESRIGWLNSLLELERQLVDPEVACECLVIAFGLLTDKASQQLNGLMERFTSNIENVPCSEVLPQLRFMAVSKLARLDSSIAISQYEIATQERLNLKLESRESVEIAAQCLGLIMRSYRPIMRAGMIEEDHLVRISRLIEHLPDLLTRAKVYSDLVCSAWCEGKSDLANELVSRFCQPILRQIESDVDFTQHEIISVLLPALFATQRSVAFGLLEKLSPSDQSEGLWSVAHMVISKSSPFNKTPVKDGPTHPLLYADALDVVEILRKIQRDDIFYVVLAKLIKGLVTKDSKLKVSGNQRSDIASNLIALIGEKLPDVNNITHDGYVIASKAQVLSLSEYRGTEWEKLIEEAKLIPNISDKALVLLEISECLPTRLDAMRKTLVADALAVIETIPSAYDRFGRLEYYLEIVKRYDVSAAKVALQKAMQLTFDMDQRDQAAQFRRNLVDLADTFEDGYAEKVAEMIDDDPARRATKIELKGLAEAQKFRRQIAHPKGSSRSEKIDSGNLPYAAWKNTSALVSGRMVPQAPRTLISYVNRCGGFSLREAIPVLAWYIENSARKFVTADAVVKNLSPLAEVLLTSTELGLSVISKVQAERDPLPGPIPQNADGIVIGENARGKAMQYIQDWLSGCATGDLILCDAYFSVEDIDFLKIVLSEAPESKLRILTTLRKDRVDAESFTCAWRSISDQDPPETEVIFVHGEMGKGVFHDRWLIAGNNGLRLGTSLNSIGRGKLSEISVVEPSRVAAIRAELDPFLRRERVVLGNRLRYEIVAI